MQQMHMIHKGIENIAYSNLGDKTNLYLNISVHFPTSIKYYHTILPLTKLLIKFEYLLRYIQESLVQ